MTRIIPRELIKHLEWDPNRDPSQEPEMVQNQSVQQKTFSVDTLVNDGKEFFSDKRDSDGNYRGVAVALQETSEEIGLDGVIATLPYLIAGKATADKDNYLWKKWLTALSEEYAGVDKDGKLVGVNQPVIITLHGGGILTPERIRQAYEEGLTEQNAAKFTEEEFNGILNGTLPSGESINLYTVDDIKDEKISEPFGRYAVWTDLETAKSKPSDRHEKNDFMNNELVIARAGTLIYLDDYFEKAKSSGKVGNWHRFNQIDPTQPQGRLLYLNRDCSGLSGNSDLDYYGRFVGVAPEARSAPK